MSAKDRRWKFECPHCRELTAEGHLIPASAGDPNMWMCGDTNRREQAKGMKKRKDWLTPDPRRRRSGSESDQ